MDGRRARSLQELIRQRQREVFVGRQPQCDGFRANLILDPLDPSRKFVFSLHGQAGIGKTALLRQLRAIALDNGALTSVVDDVEPDAVSALAAISRQWAGQGGQARSFEIRLAEYSKNRDEVLSDPQAPRAARELFLTNVVRVGKGIAKTAVPGLTAVADEYTSDELVSHLERTRAFLADKFRTHDQVELLLSPVEELSPLLVNDMRRLADHRPLALFIDDYERTSAVVEPWLLRMLEGRFGELPTNLVVVVAGQHPLDVNTWGEYAPITQSWRLDPFTPGETEALLRRRGVADQSALAAVIRFSGGLPLLVSMLAEENPRGTAQLADPSGAAVERFLKRVEDGTHREDALRAASPRVIDEDVLAVLVGPERAGDVFRRLRQHPFTEEDQGRLRYHDVVRESMVRYERGRSPERFATRNRSLARHYLERRAKLGPVEAPESADEEWQALLVEECYHRLCGDPRSALPAVLWWGGELSGAGSPASLPWLDMFAEAERDTGSALLREWRRDLSRFVDDVRGSDCEGLHHFLVSAGGGGAAPEPGSPGTGFPAGPPTVGPSAGGRGFGAPAPIASGVVNEGRGGAPRDPADQDRERPSWLEEPDDLLLPRTAPPVFGE
ncbi:ATP-binding protein [Saccharopolyspora sp. NFXS83]|uniref:ATP-binding protein n=1 Tax=Saccharopolyspora sp. NFXS83 TaxID=2993560 RepID=UPI00224A70BA|nr:ATP-binding protein [Saccharopolyspora sp. NFXS83]MCX2732970.1 ATP-binding protein [Saccharopolyspora sp. NFXS83]